MNEETQILVDIFNHLPRHLSTIIDITDTSMSSFPPNPSRNSNKSKHSGRMAYHGTILASLGVQEWKKLT